MADSKKMNLGPIDTQSKALGQSETFLGATAKAPGQVVFTAAGRDEMLGIWSRAGKSERPPAAKPLRDGQVLALAPCKLDVAGRIPLHWGNDGHELRMTLTEVLPLFGIRIPRGHLMDLGMTVYPDDKWGEVLLCNLENPPTRPSKHRSNTRPASPPSSSGPSAPSAT